MIVTIENLAKLGNVVDDDYQHVTKRITPRPAHVTPDVCLRMWESTYYKVVRDDEPFQQTPQETHRGVICVWEFGAVAHEHVAWTEYLRSNRDEAAKRAYLASQVSRTI